MRKARYQLLVLAILSGALFLGGVREVTARVEVNVNIGPPPIVVAEPPEVVLIPRTSVYYVPDPEVDVFFYNGYWWSPRGRHWYRARAYRGPWGIVERRRVPGPVFRVPRNYRAVYGTAPHIPYGEWRGNWGHPERWEHRGVGGPGPLPRHPGPHGPGPRHLP